MVARSYTPEADGGRDIQEVRLRDLDGLPTGRGYTLADNITLAAGAAAAAVTGLPNREYVLDIQGTFAAGASLNLESLGADKLTWRVVTTGIVASGIVANTYRVAANATVRLKNAGSGAVTNLYATMG